MRSSKSRSRNKQRNRSVGNVVNRVFDSSGPEGKVRGTPQQIIDKYNQLARDAQLSGDRVATENFQQHAEHYTRMLAEAQREQNERREQQEQQQRDRQQNEGGSGGGNNNPRDRQQHDGNGGGNSGGGSGQPRDRQPHDSGDDSPQRNRPQGGGANRDRQQDDDERPSRGDAPERAEETSQAGDDGGRQQGGQRSRRRPRQETPDSGSDVIDLGDGDEDTGLVETPEEKPKRKPRVRKPKAADGDGGEAPGDTNDATAAE